RKTQDDQRCPDPHSVNSGRSDPPPAFALTPLPQDRKRYQIRQRPHTSFVLQRTYSHSMVAGGLLLTSSTTRLIPRTSLVMRLEIRATRSQGSFAQSAVMPSRLSTARSTQADSYVRSSPITPTDFTGRST